MTVTVPEAFDLVFLEGGAGSHFVALTALQLCVDQAGPKFLDPLYSVSSAVIKGVCHQTLLPFLLFFFCVYVYCFVLYCLGMLSLIKNPLVVSRVYLTPTNF